MRTTRFFATKILFLLGVLFLVSCARAPLKDPKGALIPVDSQEVKVWQDLMPWGQLQEAFRKNLKAFEKEQISQEFRFGERVIPKAQYKRALEELAKQLNDPEAFHRFLLDNFDVYTVYGNKKEGEIFSTGYYDPLIAASEKKTKEKSQPIYRIPPDLVSVDLNAYADRYPELEPLRKSVMEQKSRNAILRGQLMTGSEGQKVVPYPERKSIDGEAILEGKKLEIAYMDPIDAFFLQIQGSGILEFKDGQRKRVGYAAQNGHTYVAIGKFLLDRIPLEKMSMQSIRAVLANLSPTERNEILYKNPSYVFFQELNSESLTYSGAEVTEGRTIATDQLYFPKGALAFLEIELPKFADPKALEPFAWEPKSRFVFDQDTGGAIRGPGRVDLYMGASPEAAQMAGVMKREGRLWYFAPKESFLASFSTLGE